MGEEFYAVLKLITGEEIFSLVSVDENDGDSMKMMETQSLCFQILLL